MIVDIELQKKSSDELYQVMGDPRNFNNSKQHQVILENAKKHIFDAQKKQMQILYSKHAIPDFFPVIGLVMKKNFRRKMMTDRKLQEINDR